MGSLDNLKPFNSETGKIAGQKSSKKGTKHLSTIIREVGDNIDWSKTTLKNKNEMINMYGSNGWVAIVYVAWTKAVAGDAQAMKWLAENGFGKNIDITSNGEPFKIIVDSEYAKPSFRTDTQAADSDDLAENSIE